MDLSSIEMKLEEELIRDLDEMSNLSVGSKDHVMAANSIKNLYSAMVTAKHNSDSTRVQADKNEQDAILKDEENKGKLELERLRLDIEKQAKQDQLMFDKLKNEMLMEIERDKVNYGKIELDGKLSMDRQRLDLDRAKVDIEKTRDNQAFSNKQDESLREWRKIKNEEDWRDTQFELEKAKLERELRIKEQQNRVSLIDYCIDGGVMLTKVAVGALAFGALLTFEQTGCVTSKGGLSWLTKMLF